MTDDTNGSKAQDFLILTDSTCDMPQEMADALGIAILPIRVVVEEKEYAHYLDGRELGFHDFYEKLRAGVSAKTSAANMEEFLAQMEPALAAGRDVLYLGFSSALSSTYSVGAVTAAQLAEKYPERKIYAVGYALRILRAGPSGISCRAAAASGQKHRRGEGIRGGDPPAALPLVYGG